MKGLLIKDFLTIRKRYGITRMVMNLAIIIALMLVLEDSAAICISFLLVPIEVMSMIISLTTCDEEWKWGKYAISLPVSKTQIVRSRYIFAAIMSLCGLVIVLIVNTFSYFCFPQYAYGFYLFIAIASFAVTLMFLSFILPSNYSLGVNTGFAIMLIFIVVLVILGMWAKMTGDAIMWFIVDNFEVSLGIAFFSIIAICVLSYFISVSFFKKKYR